MIKDFNEADKKGKLSEALIKIWLQEQKELGLIKSWKWTSHEWWKDQKKGFETDFYFTDNNNKSYFLESKRLSGIYFRKKINTACVEGWADADKTKRPGWFRTAEASKNNGALIMFLNDSTKTFYVHDSIKLKNWMKDWCSCLSWTPAKDGNKVNPGLVTKISWENPPAFTWDNNPADAQQTFLYCFDAVKYVTELKKWINDPASSQLVTNAFSKENKKLGKKIKKGFKQEFIENMNFQIALMEENFNLP